jgi:ADP-heptose:LPS heptosyltransferase
MDTGWARARNLLVMRLDNIGDVVMAGPVLRALKSNLPEARITLMASPGGAQAAPLLPWVDDLLVWRVLWQDLGRLPFDPGREWELVDTLAARHFDAAVILTSFSQTPHAAGFISHLAGIPLRLWESKEMAGGVLTHELPSRPDEIHQVERNLGLIESVGFRVDDRRLVLDIPAEARLGAQVRLAGAGVPAGAPYLLLLPWASCPARTYPPDRFGAAARRLARATGWPVVVAGAERDRERSATVLEPLGP